MIEVSRQALAELTKSLAKQGFVIPDYVMFQLDNCGENKNQYMFAFFSILVESKQIKFVELHFLLVGHTHCSVDQYFSVLSKVNHLDFLIISLSKFYSICSVSPKLILSLHQWPWKPFLCKHTKLSVSGQPFLEFWM